MCVSPTGEEDLLGEGEEPGWCGDPGVGCGQSAVQKAALVCLLSLSEEGRSRDKLSSLSAAWASILRCLFIGPGALVTPPCSLICRHLPSSGLGLAWDPGVRGGLASPSGPHTRECDLKEDGVCQMVYSKVNGARNSEGWSGLEHFLEPGGQRLDLNGEDTCAEKGERTIGEGRTRAKVW